MLDEAVASFLDQVTLWAAAQADLQALALVGSWARSAATPTSDIDLVLIADEPQGYLDHPEWIELFGKVTCQQAEEYGILTSLRVWYADGREVEYGLTDARWLAEPLDDGTRRVLSQGLRVLMERGSALSRLWPTLVAGRPRRRLPPGVTLRELARDELSLLTQLDRTESVARVHRWQAGALVLLHEAWQVPPWSPASQQAHIASLLQADDHGATAWGAFDGDTLVGMTQLGHQSLPTGVDRLQLVGLWVTRTHRVQGVGYTLFHRAAQTAREHGARSMYISATPSENTVRFYRAQGCRLADPFDPELLRQEPRDIHLEFVL